VLVLVLLVVVSVLMSSSPSLNKVQSAF
jgi:hypothetical protein